MDESPTDKLVLNRLDLLRFLDQKSIASVGHVSSLVAVMGEDLNTACFLHYAESLGDAAEVVVRRDESGKISRVHPVTTGKNPGPWLDRWIEVKPSKGRRFLYQAEIKNWSSTAIGGEELQFNATTRKLTAYKERRWKRHWDSERNTLKRPGTGKVLVPMKRPDDFKGVPVKPLLMFWEAIGPKARGKDHLFSIPVTYNFPFDWPTSWPKTRKFNELWVFSASSYLRSLSEDNVQLTMPNAAHRLRVLNQLFVEIPSQ